MKKVLKWVGILIVVLVAIGAIAFPILKKNTKKHSPEDKVELTMGEDKLSIFYNQPSKKGRVIFGDLVPYGEVWRTGANEPTTIETTKDLSVGGNPLKAGKYSIWTIPEKEDWTVIFNTNIPAWGIGRNGASRIPEFDALQVKIPTENTSETVEKFTIAFETTDSTTHLTFMWDNTKVAVPIE